MIAWRNAKPRNLCAAGFERRLKPLAIREVVLGWGATRSFKRSHDDDFRRRGSQSCGKPSGRGPQSNTSACQSPRAILSQTNRAAFAALTTLPGKNVYLPGGAFLQVQRAAILLRIVFHNPYRESRTQIDGILGKWNRKSGIRSHGFEAGKRHRFETRTVQNIGVGLRDWLVEDRSWSSGWYSSQSQTARTLSCRKDRMR